MPRLDERLQGPDIGGGTLDARIAQPSGALDARTQVDSLQGRQQELSDANNTDKQGFVSKLGSTTNLLKLGAAAALALSGRGDAGLGLATGTLRRAGQDVDADNAARQKRIDDLTSMVDKQQQRLASLAMSQPGLFVDENGENMVQPGEWETLLALNVPLNPAAMLANAKEGRNDVKQYEVAQTLISLGMNTKNPETVQAGLHLINKTGGLGWTNGYISQLSYADPSNIVNTLLDANEPASVMAALSFASENGTSILSPGALRLLAGKTGDNKWKIDSIDDQIKVDAYGALKWFNEVWMNEKTGDQANRLLYKANPIEALEQAFSEQPDKLIMLKKVFPATSEGDELDRVRLTSLMQAAAMLPQMQLYMSGALSGSPESAADALFKMGESIDQMAAEGMGVVRLNNLVGSSEVLGNTYSQTRGLGYDKRAARIVGSDLVSIAHMVARADGVDYASAPAHVRATYDAQAMARYDAMSAGTIMAPLPATAPKPKAAVSAATSASPAVVVPEVTTAPTSEVAALATDPVQIRDLLDRVAAIDNNVQLSDEHQNAIDNFQTWASMPRDERVVLADDPEFAAAVGAVQNMASVSHTDAEVATLIVNEERHTKSLAELDKETDPTRKKKLSEGIKRYREALKWQQDMALIDKDRLAAARKKHQEFLKQQSQRARSERR